MKFQALNLMLDGWARDAAAESGVSAKSANSGAGGQQQVERKGNDEEMTWKTPPKTTGVAPR
jgi:hypothetical protein